MDTQSLPLMTVIVAGFIAVVGSGLVRRRCRRASAVTIAADGSPEIEIVVDRGYRPAVVRVRAGQTVRLLFRRLDADPCAARVYFAEPPLSRRLPSHATTAVTITPRRVGTHLFTCEEGRYRGHLVVQPSEPGARRAATGGSPPVSSAA